MAIPRFTKDVRYRISGFTASDYRTTTDSGERPTEVVGAFRGLYRSDVGVCLLFGLDAGGNMAIPLTSVERYRFDRIEG